MSDHSTSAAPLRLWPGTVLAALLLFLWFVGPLIPNIFVSGMLGAVACGAAIVVWWLCFSRAPWIDRVGAIVVGVAAVLLTRLFIHPSIANGFMNNMQAVLSLPLLSTALVASLVASRRLSTRARHASMVGALALAAASFTLVRTGGITGDAKSDLHWRWTPTPEEMLLARGSDIPPAPAVPVKPPEPEPLQPPAAPAGEKVAAAVPSVPGVAAAPAVAPKPPADNAAAAGHPSDEEGAETAAEWPGFRGPLRDSTVHGVRISTDWSASPPQELWRRPIGPGWSSFAVQGNVLFTQEQRGQDEIVAAYKVTTGEPVWQHRDATRFWESNGGAGPRGTPTLSHGRVYALGATGILNALDATSGAVIWSRNIATDAHKPIPGWGFTASPFVVGDVVIIAATGTLVGYDARTGAPRWFGPPHKGGYSSPQPVTIDGVTQIMLLTADGVISVSPSDGTLLWENAWDGVPIVQPALATNGDVLITTGDAMGGAGIRRVAVTHQSGKWSAEERWTSSGLKPYFNDYVVHNGHAFGFDNSILACIDLADGKRAWKGGRYGHGQVLLLADQDVLLVLSEEGDLALVAAGTDQFTELAHAKAIEGKTWNHPVLVNDVLLVRNGEEMAAFRLALAHR